MAPLPRRVGCEFFTASEGARLVAAVVALALSACSLTASRRGVDAAGPLLEPEPATRDAVVPAVARLHVEGPLDVVVHADGASAVRFEGDAARLDELTAVVRDGTLFLAAEPGPVWDHGPRAVVTVPDLAALTSEGSGWIAVSGLDVPRLVVRVTGSGDVRLRGRVGELVVERTGAGRVDAAALESGASTPR